MASENIIIITISRTTNATKLAVTDECSVSRIDGDIMDVFMRRTGFISIIVINKLLLKEITFCLSIKTSILLNFPFADIDLLCFVSQEINLQEFWNLIWHWKYYHYLLLTITRHPRVLHICIGSKELFTKHINSVH